MLALELCFIYGMTHLSSTAVEPATLGSVLTVLAPVLLVVTCHLLVCVFSGLPLHCSFCSELTSRKPAFFTSCFLVTLQLSRPLIIAHGWLVCFLFEIGSPCSSDFLQHVNSCLGSLNAGITVRGHYFRSFFNDIFVCVCATTTAGWKSEDNLGE